MHFVLGGDKCHLCQFWLRQGRLPCRELLRWGNIVRNCHTVAPLIIGISNSNNVQFIKVL